MGALSESVSGTIVGMKEDAKTLQRVYGIVFARVYPMYIQKVERKGRTKEEVDEAIRWLFGYTQKGIEKQIEKESDLKTFVDEAPKLNPLRSSITGLICGVRVEEVKDPVYQAVRYLDKLVDEIAKGRPMEKILRK